MKILRLCFRFLRSVTLIFRSIRGPGRPEASGRPGDEGDEPRRRLEGACVRAAEENRALAQAHALALHRRLSQGLPGLDATVVIDERPSGVLEAWLRQDGEARPDA